MANSKRRCLNCKDYFPVSDGMILPVGYLHSDECVLEYSRKMRTKHEKKEHTATKKRLKDNDRSFQINKTQQIFNKYIRLRDHAIPCVSCGRFHEGQYHAGHYRTVGANPELRFDEHNCHKQCSPCNNFLSGNLVNYRINLVVRFGMEYVENLEKFHEPKRYTIDDLKQIQETYKRKTKEMES